MFSKRSGLVRTRPAAIPYAALANHILGVDYDLSLVFVGDKRTRTLNRQYRGKDKPTNVLSFPLEHESGEIFLNPRRIMLEARSQGKPYANYTAYLFIHGLLHLKGLRHGNIMEAREAAYMRDYRSM
ncbi:MAG: rRNA maturation RNase YbeY [Candidatus Vogelbacteria bacterium]|nr:rRNA maturation RNase YbeY [Candidatus Vogelbacteria bacterium]